MATKETTLSVKKTAAMVAAETGMNDELRKVYERVVSVLDEVDKQNVLARWTLGREIEEVMGNERTYGENAAIKLSEALNIDVQELYRYRNFANTFTKQDVAALLKRKTVNGRNISWSHLDHLTRVPNDNHRNKLIEAVFVHNMTVRELAAAIQKKLGNRSNNAKGRPRVGPKTPGAALSLLTKHAQVDSDVFALVNQSIKKVTDSPEDYASDEFLNEITEAKMQTTVIATAANEILETLGVAEGLVTTRLRAKKTQAAIDKGSDKATVRAAAKKVLAPAKKSSPAAATVKKPPLQLKPKPKLQLAKKSPSKVA